MASTKPKKSKKRNTTVERLKSRLSKLGLSKKPKLMHRPKGELKMSEMLLDFLEYRG